MQEIFKTIENIAKKISNELKFAEFGYTQNQNSTGDTQLKFDVLSDKIIEDEFKNSSLVKALVSEEKDEMLTINEKGEFIVAYDPLDGSSLFDVNFAIGSIFGIYKNEISSKNLVAAAYTLYGPRLEMVICENSPKLYRLNPQNEFVFINELKLKEKGKLNATGATQKGWSEKHKKLVNCLFEEGYRLRYSGAMVSDLHQILIKGGGLFSYPATSDAPNGKLRVTFEVLPFAYIYEKAGGATTNGTSNSLFEIKIEKIHQTSPCFFGSKYEIAKLHEIYGK
ncbi:MULTISPECIES: class 1 fructose-bisphosphatase [unclassified Campylobacter]|uniref:class 1 fructose-bisphosphatase n=1 Tax=unclassified Campylobacter TaxID=2593542 RepID=UPI0022E9F99A|nr:MULTISPECIES: class 1 fructose-bisphosphatase [unclassified Campylobacter]MDA3079747.1 class 1 fructose-bisphosphatase [Campylobacter sp. CS_NA2]MDA3081493.1 class 1 fructose-bisphosphatase [Campylobacter sp. CS_NA1]MDA3085844.1 class 1 fructose-bisphosphatase [Campylobacter sp. CS_ED1]MDA3090579.1 class 1 fructose-bisphosphatase [Campylobacter sp. CS_ED2]WBR50641.1 class 1 fructose-bisphosphatase [Campylobacter sp. CS_NA3]